MYHGGQLEGQCQASEVEGVIVGYFKSVFSDAIVTFYHVEGFGVANDYHVGVKVVQYLYGSGMIRFHVVYDQVVRSCFANSFVNILIQCVDLA